MKQEVKQGQTDYTVLILIRDTDGAPKTGLTNASAGIDVGYSRVETDNDVAWTDGAPVALATPALTDPHLDWGFLQVDATKAPGVYRLDCPAGVFASGAWSAIVSLICTGCDPTHIEFVLVPEAPYTGVNVAQWLGQACHAVSENGVPKVDLDQIGGVVQSLTDFKDFVDTGYVPGTHSIALVDTTTTNTDMKGTDGANTTVPDAAGVAATPAEVASALTDINLDHLCKTATAGADMTAEVTDNTILSRILANGDTSIFDPATDGLQPIRDRGDAAWVTGGGTGLTALASGTAQAGAAGTIQLAAGSAFANDELNGNIINIHTGTGAGQSRVITDYNGATDTATVSPNWTTNPDNTSQYEIIQGSSNIATVGLTAQTANDNGADINAILGDTNELQTDWVNGGRLDNLLDAIPTTAMRGTDNAALASVLGTLNNVAAEGNPTDVDTLMQYIKQLINVLIGTTGIAAFPAEAAPGNAVSLAEVIRAIHVDTSTTLDTLVKDIPTTAELALRTLLAADYVVVGDTIAGVTVVNGLAANVITAASINGDAITEAKIADNAIAGEHLNATACTKIIDDFETQSQADPTGFHVNVKEVNGTAQTAGDITADTNELQTDWVNGGRLDLILDSILAMLDDARGEPAQGAPPVNPDAMTKLDYIYKLMRNKLVTSATLIEVYNDAGAVVDHKSTISDDGSDFTREEFVAGP